MCNWTIKFNTDSVFAWNQLEAENMTVYPTDQPQFQQKICSVYQRISSCGKPRNMWVSFWWKPLRTALFWRECFLEGNTKTLWGIFRHAPKKKKEAIDSCLVFHLPKVSLSNSVSMSLVQQIQGGPEELSKLSSCGTLVCKELTFPQECLVWLLHGSKHWKVKTPSIRINVKKNIFVLFQFPSEWCHHVFRKWTNNVLTNKRLWIIWLQDCQTRCFCQARLLLFIALQWSSQPRCVCVSVCSLDWEMGVLSFLLRPLTSSVVQQEQDPLPPLCSE